MPVGFRWRRDFREQHPVVLGRQAMESLQRPLQGAGVQGGRYRGDDQHITAPGLTGPDPQGPAARLYQWTTWLNCRAVWVPSATSTIANGSGPPAAPHSVALRFGSPSISTVAARVWRYAARCTAVVVFPTPPLSAATVMYTGQVYHYVYSHIYNYDLFKMMHTYIYSF